jgi:hypothetical protein
VVRSFAIETVRLARLTTSLPTRDEVSGIDEPAPRRWPVQMGIVSQMEVAMRGVGIDVDAATTPGLPIGQAPMLGRFESFPGAQLSLQVTIANS